MAADRPAAPAPAETLSGGAAFVVDHELRYRLAEGPALAAVGFVPRDLIGRTVRDVMGDALADAYEPNYRRALAGESLAVEHLSHGRWYVTSLVPVRGSGSAIDAALAFSHDITERKVAEAALLRSEERLLLALGAAAMGTWDWAVDSGEMVWNDRAYEIAGLPRGASIPLDAFFSRVDSADAGRFDDATRRALASGAFDCEFRFHRPDGGERWVASRGHAVSRDADGKTTRMIGVVADITEQRAADEARRRHAARDAFLVELDDALRPLSTPATIRRAACAVLRRATGADRVQSGEVEGDDRHLAVVEDASKDESDFPQRHVLDAFGPAIGELRRGRRVLSADVAAEPGWGADERAAGAALGVRAFAAAARDRDGKLAMTIAILFREPHAWSEDELWMLEQTADRMWNGAERARASQMLVEADRRKDEFLATLAHELRNPLAPLGNALRLLRAAGRDDARADAALATMERQFAHLVRLVDDLLDVARISRGKVALKPGRLDLRASIDHALEQARPAIDALGHALAVELPERSLPVSGDETRLAQVFANLLLNAAKFTPAGGRIRLVAERAGAEVSVRVTDSGVGIEPSMLGDVFELFTQVDTSAGRSQGGLGIGLALARTLVEMQGGRIRAASSGRGLGSEFEVRLPLDGDDVSGPSADGTPATTRRSAERPRRVLVVDDSADSASTLAMLLEHDGHAVRIEHDGLAAIAAAATFAPDVVLLDIGMPGIDGYETARRLRTLPDGDRLVLIAQTGWGQDDDLARARAAGFDAHFVKPIDHDRLAKWIARRS